MAEPLPALDVRVPQPTEGGGVASINPFQAGVDIMNMRKLSNENQQFQLQQWANRGIAGIMSQHPNDEEGGLREILSSPFAPYAPGFVAQIRESNASLANTHKTNLETQKMGGEIVQTGLNGFIKTTAPMLYDAMSKDATLDQLTSIYQGQRTRMLAGMPPALRDQFDQGLSGWWTGITANAPNDSAHPERTKAYYLSNFHNSTIAAGFSPEDWKHAYGEPGSITQTITDPDGTKRTVTMPTMRDLQTGAIRGVPGIGGAPQMYTPGIEPGYHEPGQQPYGTSGTTSNFLMPPSMGGAGYTGVPSIPGAGPPPQAAPSGSATSPAGGPITTPTLPAGESPAAEDETPLWTADVMKQNPPQGQMDGSGTQWNWQGGPSAASAVLDRSKSFNDKEVPRFADSQAAMQQLSSMDASLDRLKDTLLRPGTMPEERAAAIKAFNTGLNLFNGVFGTNIPNYFGQPLQAYESFMKDMTKAQFSVLATQFGHQREAGTVVATAGRAVPGIENSFLGDKLVLEELKSNTLRYQDYYKFNQEWMRTHRNDPLGGDTAFNKLHPPEQYQNKVLERFGLTKDGFKNQAAIENAHDHNWIDDNMAAQAHNQLVKKQQREQQQGQGQRQGQ